MRQYSRHSTVANQELREVMASYQEIETGFAQVPEHTYVISSDYKCLFSSFAGGQSIGVQPGIFDGGHWREMGLSIDTKKEIVRLLDQVFATGKTLRSVSKTSRSEEETSYFEYRASPLYGADRNISAVLCSIRDISPLRNAEEALSVSEARYKSLFDYMQNAFEYYKVIIDDKGRPVDLEFLEVNPAFEKQAGLEAQSVVGRRLSHINASVEAAWIQAMGEVGLTGRPLMQEQYLSLQDKWRRVSAYSPKQGYVAITSENITEQKQAMQVLYESEERLRLAIAFAPFPSMLHAEDGEVIQFNDIWTKLSGYTHTDISTVTEWCRAAYGTKQFEMKTKIDSLYYATDLVEVGEYPITTKQGEQRIWAFRATPLGRLSDGRRAVISMAIDITERKQMEKDLTRLDRLNLVGEMAASIGHEVRNPMTTVRGYLQMLEMKPDFAHRKQQFQLMISEIDRANAIITEYISLAKNKSVHLERKNITDIVRSVLVLLEADSLQRGHSVELISANVPALLLDENEIRQLVLNLVHNSLEAMSRGGRVLITIVQQGEHIILAVQDNGPGIPAEIYEQLGKPFLTTKEMGTGLGLSVCYRIAQRHKAHMEVETGPQGTTFSIAFPRVL